MSCCCQISEHSQGFERASKQSNIHGHKRPVGAAAQCMLRWQLLPASCKKISRIALAAAQCCSKLNCPPTHCTKSCNKNAIFGRERVLNRRLWRGVNAELSVDHQALQKSNARCLPAACRSLRGNAAQSQAKHCTGLTAASRCRQNIDNAQWSCTEPGQAALHAQRQSWPECHEIT